MSRADLHRLIRVTIAARAGGDPGNRASGPRSVRARQHARRMSIGAPSEGTGTPGQIIEKCPTEGCAPRSRFIETVTDNRNRTASSAYLLASGGRMGESGRSLGCSFRRPHRRAKVFQRGRRDDGCARRRRRTSRTRRLVGSAARATSQGNTALVGPGSSPQAPLTRLPKSTVAIGRDMAGRVEARPRSSRAGRRAAGLRQLRHSRRDSGEISSSEVEAPRRSPWSYSGSIPGSSLASLSSARTRRPGRIRSGRSNGRDSTFAEKLRRIHASIASILTEAGRRSRSKRVSREPADRLDQARARVVILAAAGQNPVAEYPPNG
jgi:hypothetical protein